MQCLAFNPILCMYLKMLFVQNNVVIHSIYQTFFAGAQELHWMVDVGRYQIVGESLQKNS